MFLLLQFAIRIMLMNTVMNRISNEVSIYPARAARVGYMSSGLVSILYVCMYVCDPKKTLNGTLGANLPFQTGEYFFTQFHEAAPAC